MTSVVPAVTQSTFQSTPAARAPASVSGLHEHGPGVKEPDEAHLASASSARLAYHARENNHRSMLHPCVLDDRGRMTVLAAKRTLALPAGAAKALAEHVAATATVTAWSFGPRREDRSTRPTCGASSHG